MNYYNGRNVALILALMRGTVSFCYADNLEIKPNVIFIYADQWRRMAVGHYNNIKYKSTVNEGDPVITPNIDKIISEGMIFNNAVCSAPISSPNRATLLTGLYPLTHGLVSNTNYEVFGLENRTIAHELTEAGYNTAHIGKWHISTVGNNDFLVNEKEKRGFEYWYGSPNVDHAHFDASYYHASNEIDGLEEYVQGGKKLPNPFIPTLHYSSYKLKKKESWVGDHITRKALDYLKNTYHVRNESKPFALYISYNPPHTIHGNRPIPGNEYSWRIGGMSGTSYGSYRDPNNNKAEYRAPLKYETLYQEVLPLRPNVPEGHYSINESRPGYFGSITSIDECIGQLDVYLAATKDPRYSNKTLKETTIVIITADHGEMMGSHGRMTKGVPEEESIGVPFIIRWPGKVKAGAEEDFPISAVDVAPTILGLLGTKFHTIVDGNDYSSLIKGEKCKNIDKNAFISLRNWRAVRSKNDIYIAEFGNDGQVKSLCYYDLLVDPFQQHTIVVNDSCDNRYKKRIMTLHTDLRRYLDKYDKKNKLNKF